MSPGQVSSQKNSADECHYKLHQKQSGGGEEQTPIHKPTTERWYDQTGGARRKPCAGKVQPLQRQKQTDAWKEEKAADKEQGQDNTEEPPVTDVRIVII